MLITYILYHTYPCESVASSIISTVSPESRLDTCSDEVLASARTLTFEDVTVPVAANELTELLIKMTPAAMTASPLFAILNL